MKEYCPQNVLLSLQPYTQEIDNHVLLDDYKRAQSRCLRCPSYIDCDPTVVVTRDATLGTDTLRICVTGPLAGTNQCQHDTDHVWMAAYPLRRG